MINNRRVLAFIPARGGSKGVKNKNIKLLNGQELIGYTINSAKKSGYIDNILVSTDSQNIKEVAEKYGANVPFLRPDNLANDKAKTIDAVLHGINYLKELGDTYDILILLQPTSPLRKTIDIDNSLEFFINNNCEGLTSVNEVTENPLLIRSLNNNILTPLLNKNSTVRRQDMDKYYKLNGAIYINLVSEISENTSFGDNKIGYIMSDENSVDIDTEQDFFDCENILKKIDKRI